MADFRSQDYKDILFPVHALTSSMDIFETYPKLNDFSEFKKKLKPSLQINKVFKYIVYVYDQKSPFYTQVDDITNRKKEAAVEVDFPTNEDGEFIDEVIDILNCKNLDVNAMIIRYCRIQGQEFTNLAVSQEVFYQVNLQLLTFSDDPAKKAKLDDDATKMAKRLNEKSRAFLSQETKKSLYDELWSLAEDEAANIKITPEDYAV